MITTLKGLTLLAKAQTGVKLEFTKVVIGDGILEDGEDLKKLTGLINHKMDVDIHSIDVIGDGTSRIKAIVTNANLSIGFFMREIGIMAIDPDEGEILYSIINNGNESGFLRARSETWIAEEELNLITVIGNAENVTVNISDSLFATKEELSRLKIELGTIISDKKPTEPYKLWLKPMGSTTLSGAFPGIGIPIINLSGVHIGQDPPETTSELWVKPLTE